MSSPSPNASASDLTDWAVLDDRGGLFTCRASCADEALGKWFASRPKRLPHPMHSTTHTGRLVHFAWTEREDAGLSTVKVTKRSAVVCSASYVLPSDVDGAEGKEVAA